MKNRRFTPYLVLAGFTSALITTNLAFEEPVSVHADAGEFIGAVDYITAASGADAVALSSLGSGASAATAGLMLAVYMLSNPNVGTGGTFDVTGCSYMSGLYLDADGNERFGCIIAPPQAAFPADGGGITIMYGNGIDLRITSGTVATTFTNNGGRIQLDISSWCQIVNVVSPRTLLWGDWSDSNFRMVGIPNISPPSLNTYLSYVSGSAFLALGSSGIVPSGELDRSNPEIYIENVLRPYVQINYPDYEYLLPEEPQPSTEYATDDIVPGIPKDWTIINPELPTAPHFEISKPDADLTVLDPSDTLSDFSNPIGFWFTLLDRTLDAVHLKPILFVALAFGLLTYIFWKLGR